MLSIDGFTIGQTLQDHLPADIKFLEVGQDDETDDYIQFAGFNTSYELAQETAGARMGAKRTLETATMHWEAVITAESMNIAGATKFHNRATQLSAAINTMLQSVFVNSGSGFDAYYPADFSAEVLEGSRGSRRWMLKFSVTLEKQS